MKTTHLKGCIWFSWIFRQPAHCTNEEAGVIIESPLFVRIQRLKTGHSKQQHACRLGEKVHPGRAGVLRQSQHKDHALAAAKRNHADHGKK